MNRLAPRAVLPFALMITVSMAPAAALSQPAGPDTPRALLEAWVDLWATLDLDTVSDLFIQDGRLTYFSSETEGLLEGFERIVEHHAGFGFVPGGSNPESRIWVDEVRIVDFGDTALIGAIWYFGDPESPANAQRGPMTVVAVRTDSGYRIAHMNFATYAGSQP